MESIRRFARYCAEQIRSTRVLRYLIAGGLVAIIDFVLLYILTDFFHVWYLTSSLAALLIAFIVNFLLQKFWAFQNHSLAGVHMQFSLYVLLLGVNIILNTILLYLFVEQAHLWYLLAQLLTSAMLACMNFIVYRRFIFV